MVFSVFRRLGYQHGAPSLDNFIFKLYYRWTALILIVFSFTITCRLRFGYSFYCSSSVSVTVKCYGRDLYSLPAALQDDKFYKDRSENKRHYLNYYPWVNLLFLVKAFNFYLPHLLWKSYERGYIYKLTAGIQKCVDKGDKHDLQLCRLAKYVFATQGKHKLYTVLYIFSEISNFVVSLAHAFWLEIFFNITSVPDSITYVINTWSDFKNFYFPREGSCEFWERGTSGDMQRHEVRCELPLNDLYMYTYLFLKAWYTTIIVLTVLMLVYRFCLFIASVRLFSSRISSPLSAVSVLQAVCHQRSYSDWFFFSRLEYAMSDVDFADMVDKISIISQGKNPQSDEYKRFTVFNGLIKDLESSINASLV